MNTAKITLLAWATVIIILTGTSTIFVLIGNAIGLNSGFPIAANFIIGFILGFYVERIKDFWARILNR